MMEDLLAGSIPLDARPTHDLKWAIAHLAAGGTVKIARWSSNPRAVGRLFRVVEDTVQVSHTDGRVWLDTLSLNQWGCDPTDAELTIEWGDA